MHSTPDTDSLTCVPAVRTTDLAPVLTRLHHPLAAAGPIKHPVLALEPVVQRRRVSARLPCSARQLHPRPAPVRGIQQGEEARSSRLPALVRQIIKTPVRHVEIRLLQEAQLGVPLRDDFGMSVRELVEDVAGARAGGGCWESGGVSVELLA